MVEPTNGWPHCEPAHYIIATANSPEGLERHVNSRIRDGYVPIGGIVIDRRPLHEHLLQAMLKPRCESRGVGPATGGPAFDGA